MSSTASLERPRSQEVQEAMDLEQFTSGYLSARYGLPVEVAATAPWLEGYEAYRAHVFRQDSLERVA